MKNQELALLQIFDMVMKERSVTVAADQLATTQPAVSNAIARMRTIWNDPLFIKKGRQIEPTAFAYNLWQKIRAPLEELSNAVNITQFDPNTSNRQFRVALPDWAVELIWLPLLDYLQKKAPNINIYAVPFTQELTKEQLRSAQIDLAFGIGLEKDSSLRSLTLIEDRYWIVIGKNHDLARTKVIKTEYFLNAKHLLITDSYKARDSVSDVLTSGGLTRQIIATVNQYSAAIPILQRTDYIASVPSILAGIKEYCSHLVFLPHPIPLDSFAIQLTWHARSEKDTGFEWFKNIFSNLATASLVKAQRNSNLNIINISNKLSA